MSQTDSASCFPSRSYGRRPLLNMVLISDPRLSQSFVSSYVVRSVASAYLELTELTELHVKTHQLFLLLR